MARYKQCWVTKCLTEEDEWPALVLGTSFRLVLTRHSLAVLVSSKITPEMKSKLKSVFDLVYPIGNSCLAHFDKLIFLSPSALALRNPDHLFLEKVGGEEMNGVDFVPDEIKMDGKVFPVSIGLRDQLIINSEDNLCLVNLRDLPMKSDTLLGEIESSESLLGKFVYKRWLELKEIIGSSQPFLQAGFDKMNEAIAVVGISTRLPLSKDVDSFWKLLSEGRSGMGNVPGNRWTSEQVITHCLDTDKTIAGFLPVPIDQFDPKFFGISPKEAVFMDPQFRLLLELTWEALEDGGIDPNSLRGSNGSVFAGSWQNEFSSLLKQPNGLDFYRTYQGNSIGAGVARISQLLGLTGPSIAVEHGCSASMVAVHMAVRSLRFGESSLAIASGTNIILRPFNNNFLPGIVATDGKCKTFDSEANGYGRAEGCGVLVLKRLSDALKDQNKIWGLIRGSAVHHEGLTRSMGTPTVACEAKTMESALKDAQISPDQVSFVEAHGTGTAVGDPIEIAAIRKAYGGVERETKLIIGSGKTNVGHTESCSGITGIIKVLLSLKNEVIPQHLNLKEINRSLVNDLEAIPAEIPLNSIPWKGTSSRRRIAGVSSFGINGGDAHVIIEEPLDSKLLKQRLVIPQFQRDKHILKVTAKSQKALNELVDTYKEYLASNDLDNVSDIAYHSNVGRASLKHRAFFICEKSSPPILQVGSDSKDFSGKLCFLFTGQGSQYPDMSKTLYETSPVFRLHFDYCDHFLREKFGIEINQFMFNGKGQDRKNFYNQISIFVLEYSLLKLWESWGIKPDVVLGHSLGEFCGVVAANLVSVEDALKLVYIRSLLIEKLPEGKMLVLKEDEIKTRAYLREYYEEKEQLDIAAINSSDQTVIAGNPKDVEEFLMFLKKKGVKCSMLQSSHAFHSRMMEPILDELFKAGNEINYSKGDITFVSSVFGRAINPEELNGSYWAKHTRDRVEFLRASKAAVNDLGCRLFIEIGPHPVLSAITKQNSSEKLLCLPSLRKKEDDWKTIFYSLGTLFTQGFDVNWKGLDMFYEREALQVPLPTYPFQRSKFWPLKRNVAEIIHPLLGSLISSPITSKIFQSVIILDELEYLKDHSLNEVALFPGAGYLELLLMGGYCAAHGKFEMPSKPIEIKDVKIKAPLGLPEGVDTVCQTVVNFKEGENTIQLFHEGRDEEGTAPRWVLHASGSYIAGASAEKVLKSIPKMDELKEMMTSKEQSLKADVYDKSGKTGLRFGTAFKTLKQFWLQGNELLAKVKVPQDQRNYLVHPTLNDGMIQAAFFLKIRQEGGSWGKLIRVPVKCKSFKWFTQLNTPTAFIFAQAQKVSILDEEGNLIALMVGIEGVETTANNIQALLETQVKPIPNMYRIEWKQSLSFEQNRAFLNFKLTHSNVIPQNNQAKYQNLNGVVTSYILKAFLGLGWAPKLNQEVNLTQFMIKLAIDPQHKQLTKQFLTLLVKDDLLKPLADEKWAVHQAIAEHPLPEINSDISSQLLKAYGASLDKILTGEIPALKIFFPGDSMTSATKFYDQMFHPFRFSCETLLGKYLDDLKNYHGAKSLSPPTLRVLEIGGGTGAATSCFLKILDDSNLQYDYIFTDISPAFFFETQKRFEGHGRKIKFHKFDLEVHPTSQGFPLAHFDLIISAHVINVMKDVRKALINIRRLLRPQGTLWMTETVGENRLFDVLFGPMEGYWRFNDFDLRKNHPMMPMMKWKQVLNEVGFNKIATNVHEPEALFVFRMDPLENSLSQKEAEGATWLILHHEEEIDYVSKLKDGMDRFGIKTELSSSKEDELFKSTFDGIIISWGLNSDIIDQKRMAFPFLQFLQKWLDLPKKQAPQIVLLTSGQLPIGDDCLNPSQSTLLGIVKAVLNESRETRLRAIDINLGDSVELVITEIFNRLQEPQSYLVGLRDKKRFTPLLTPDKFRRELVLPSSGRFQLIFGNNLAFDGLEQFELAPNEVEVKVNVAALNFLDVFKFSGNSEPIEKLNIGMGSDFAGVITKVGKSVEWSVGDEVFGYCFKPMNLPSHVLIRKEFVRKIPSALTLAEASCIPVAFSTAYYCLVEIAQARKGEVVLIHSGCGGVGLFAIKIAKYLGLEIICTAGNKMKRNYLKGLGIKNVFDSRSLSFAREIIRVTGGKGVDIVLNSITGPGFKEASLEACGEGARFIEMSKINIFSADEVEAIRKDVKYFIFNLPDIKDEERIKLIDEMERLLEGGHLDWVPFKI